MKKNILLWLFLVIGFIQGLAVNVFADMGPKPSVEVEFKGLESETYYVTLLSEYDSSGPYTNEDSYQGNDYDIWKKFNGYKDSDEFYFLGEFWDCSEYNQFMWVYYPPTTFKILIYFREYDSFVVSEIYEQYAFSSRYIVDVESFEEVETIQAKQSYDYK